MDKRETRTSITDPIRIATLPIQAGDGRIGVTFCPGKQGPSLAGPDWLRDLDTDLEAFKAWGCTTLVSLVKQHELYELQVPDLGKAVSSKGMEWFHLPIVDGAIPGESFATEWQYAGLKLRQKLRHGHSIIVHCRGGLGRAGSIAAKLLIELGLEPDQAITALRTVRPGAIENSIQETYVQAQQSISSQLDEEQGRILACLIGGAIGDALGYQVEFDSLEEIHLSYGKQGVRLPISGEAIVSDDTQMSLFTLEGLLRAMGEPVDVIIESIRSAYLDWYQTQQLPVDTASIYGTLALEDKLQVRRAPGNTCLDALQSGARGTPLKSINNSKGCGTVMRVAPLGFFSHQFSAAEVYDLGLRSSALTHGHHTAQVAGGALALLIRQLMTGGELPTAIEAVLALLDKQQHSEETTGAIRVALELADSGAVSHAENIDLIYADPTLKHKTSRGWVAEEALAIGIYAALVGDDLADVIAIAANHDGDSDSTASIAGQIYGAWKGVLSLPDYQDTITDVHAIMMKTLPLVNHAPVE